MKANDIMLAPARLPAGLRKTKVTTDTTEHNVHNVVSKFVLSTLWPSCFVVGVVTFLLQMKIRFAYLPALAIIVAAFLPATAVCQKKVSLRVKTFDQSMKPVGNIEVSLNDSGYFMIGSKGTAIVELIQADSKIISVRIKDETIEPASWAVSKGVVEIVIRPKSYRILRFVLRLPDGKGVPGASITYLGSKSIGSKSDPAGKFVLQLPVKENVKSADQFRVEGFQVVALTLTDSESILNVTKAKQQIPIARTPAPVVKQRPPLKQSTPLQGSAYVLNLASVDSISSLASFYSLIRNTPMSTLTVNEKNILDAKFYALLAKDRSIRATSAEQLSETSNLDEDSDTLLAEALYKNDSLENRLSVLHARQEDEQLQSRQWLVGIGVVIVAFALLVILLIILYSRLRERTLSLQQAKRKIEQDSEGVDEVVVRQTRLLSESNRELNSFLNRSSQELRSTLQSIIEPGNTIEHMPRRELVDRVENATATMDRVLTRVIDISEIGQTSGKAEKIKLVDVINNVRSAHMAAAADKPGRPLQFNVNCGGDVMLYTDRSLLEMVLNNLVENAIHFSMIKEAAGPAIVEIAVVTRGDMLELSVYDNGVGISKAVKPKMFNMFFSGSEDATGDGLGLYAVKKGVLAMNGKIDIMTEEGVFTRVVVMIPQNSSPLASRRVPVAEAKLSLSTQP